MGKSWQFLERASILKDIFFAGPVQAGIAWVIGVMAQHVPVISALGIFGILACGLVAYLVLSGCNALNAFAKKRARSSTTTAPSRLMKFFMWRGWKWVVAVALFVVGALAIETRPPMPRGIPIQAITLPVATHSQLNQPEVHGKSVILSHVPRSPEHPMLIRNKTFQNCEIIGPAVVAIRNSNDLKQCTFMIIENRPWDKRQIRRAGEGEDLSIEWFLLEYKGDTTVGMLGVESCSFNKCTFIDVSFAGPSNILHNFRTGIRTR